MAIQFRQPGVPLFQDRFVHAFRWVLLEPGIVQIIGINSRIVALVFPGVASMRADGDQVKRVAAMPREVVDDLHLIALAGAVRIAFSAIEKAFRVARSAEEQMAAALTLEPLRMLWVNHDLIGQWRWLGSIRLRDSDAGQNTTDDRINQKQADRLKPASTTSIDPLVHHLLLSADVRSCSITPTGCGSSGIESSRESFHEI